MIDTKDILYKYFELHEKPSTIAKELNVKAISKEELNILCGNILRVILSDHQQQGNEK